MHDAEREDLRERIAQAIFHCGAFDLYTQNMNRQPIPYGDYAGRPFLRAADAVLALLAESEPPKTIVVTDEMAHAAFEVLFYSPADYPREIGKYENGFAVVRRAIEVALTKAAKAPVSAPCDARHRHAPFVCAKCGYVGGPVREVSAPEVTDEIVQVALDAYHDCEKYNTDAVNMRSALEAAYHAEQAKGQFMGDFHRAAAERFPAEVTDETREASNG